MSMDFLIEMAWKSVAISGGGLLIVALLRSRSAADRAAVLRVAVLMLLSLPLVSLLFPGLVVETSAPAAVPFQPIAPLSAIDEAELASFAAIEPLEASAPVHASGDWNDPGILFLLLYLGGAAMVAARLVGGLWTLGRWTAEAGPVTSPEWIAAFERSDAPAGVRLLASGDATSPLSWGWLRPVILIDAESLRRPEDADAILAHELAHIARRDWLSLIASRLTVAIFWFNPLVWRMDGEVAHQAEEAADSAAAAKVEPTRYAQTLLDLARQDGGFLPANAMAGSEPGLSRRVRALLDGRFRRTSGSFWTLVAICACVAIAAPVAALEFVPRSPEPPAAPVAPLPNSAAPVAPVAPAALPATVHAGMAVAVPAAAPTAPAAPVAAALLVQSAAPAAPPAPAAAESPASPPAPPARSRERALVDVDSLIAMRIHGVDARYIEAMTSLGEAFRKVSPDQLVAMRIHGVSPQFVRELQGQGFRHVTPEQAVTLRIQGISAKAEARARARVKVERPVRVRPPHPVEVDDAEQDADDIVE